VTTWDLTTLSLGGGVQSSCLLLMACAGALPKPDVAIFADTRGESPETYRWLAEVLTPAAAQASIKLVVTSHGDLRNDVLTKTKGNPTLPYKTRSRATGEEGYFGRRGCTRDYKTRPIDRAIRAELGGGSMRGRQVETWLGISTDEIGRMKDSRTAWQTLRYPLVELGMSRADCARWLAGQGFGVAPRSACFFCPNHKSPHWRQLKQAHPDLWALAVELDDAARDKLPGVSQVDAFLHKARVPLPLVDLRTPEDHGQGALFGEDDACVDGSAGCFL
jgi:hypothetical protein